MLLRVFGISGLVVIGGDGSLAGAHELHDFFSRQKEKNPEFGEMDLSIVGIPGSIDNDIALTDMSIGADTTLNTIIECIDKLRDTAASHKRVIIVEVMGRLRGYLATMSGLATGADKILVREEAVSENEINEMLQTLQDSFSHGQKAGIIVRSEGAVFSTGYIKETIHVLLKPKKEVRETVLGHLQRGGSPTTFDRILATRFGVEAVNLIANGKFGQMVCLRGRDIKSVQIKEAVKELKPVDPKCQVVRTAEALGIELGKPD